MKTFFKNLLHVIAIAGATMAAHQLSSGVAITSGNVLIPTGVAMAGAAGGAIVKALGGN